MPQNTHQPTPDINGPAPQSPAGAVEHARYGEISKSELALALGAVSLLAVSLVAAHGGLKDDVAGTHDGISAVKHYFQAKDALDEGRNNDARKYTHRFNEEYASLGAHATKAAPYNATSLGAAISGIVMIQVAKKKKEARRIN